MGRAGADPGPYRHRALPQHGHDVLAPAGGGEADAGGRKVMQAFCPNALAFDAICYVISCVRSWGTLFSTMLRDIV
jgi:hypothetical protein